MKKVIFPIIFAVALPLILVKTVNPNMEPAGIVIAVLVGLGIGSGINALVFRKKKEEASTDTEAQ